jgi:predicted flap endonuclease-1-like 5' DNA nuclease
VKRLAKTLGLLAGIGTVLWVMRDRLVSLTVAREPEHPSFRVPTPSEPPPVPQPTATAEPDDLTEITGIGPVFAGRLSGAGIRTYADLAEAPAALVAAATGASESRAREWIAAAATRT